MKVTFTLAGISGRDDEAIRIVKRGLARGRQVGEQTHELETIMVLEHVTADLPCAWIARAQGALLLKMTETHLALENIS